MNRSRLSTVTALAAGSVLTQAAIAQTGGATGAAGGAGSQTGAAGSQTGGATGAAGEAGSQTGAAAGGTGANTSVPGADKKIAVMVAQTDLAEIPLGNLALE